MVPPRVNIEICCFTRPERKCRTPVVAWSHAEDSSLCADHSARARDGTRGVGEPCRDMHTVIGRNVRFPHATLGDLRAQVSCVLTGQRRLAEIVTRWGVQTVTEARDAIFAQTERMERASINEIPDGVYRAGGFLDNDGIDLSTPLPVNVVVTVSGSTVEVDLTDCADQTAGDPAVPIVDELHDRTRQVHAVISLRHEMKIARASTT
ncbi:hydantoinase B/oxoprolinase family protein, partial [Kibdelosporangium lantanae]